MSGFRKTSKVTAVLMVIGLMTVQSVWADEEDTYSTDRRLPGQTSYSMKATMDSQNKAETLIESKTSMDELIVETAALLSMQQRVAQDLGQIDATLSAIDTQMPEETLYIDAKTSDVVMLKTVRAALSRSFGQSAAAHGSAIEKYSPVVTSVIKAIRGDYFHDQMLIQNPEDKENLQSAVNKITTYAKISFVRDQMMLDQNQLMKLFLISKKSFISNPIFTMDEALLIGRLVYAAQERIAVL